MSMLIAAAALAAAWGSAPAVPSPTVAAPVRRIAVSDLDLSRRADIARLDRRIAVAARRVCHDPSSALFGSYAAARSCIQATRRAATPQRDAAVEAARGIALATR